MGGGVRGGGRKWSQNTAQGTTDPRSFMLPPARHSHSLTRIGRLIFLYVRTIHSLTSFAFGECRAPAGSFALVARLRLASCEAPPFEIERATLRGSVCGHVRYILENSKAILRLGHDWKVETTLRTWLRQRFLFAVQIEGLVLQMAAARTHSQQTRRREFEVCDDVLHYGTTCSPFLGVFVVCVHVPVIERFFAGPKAHLVEPSRIVWVYPPGQVKESWKGFQVIARICKENLELLVAVRAREADALHAEINGHSVSPLISISNHGRTSGGTNP